MSAPTPAPGDDRPREGYYPDPSIPGYVRYWNGASWVPGTSRPAPADGEPLSPPPGVRPARPAVPEVEATGPHFFDEDPPAGPAPAGESSAAPAPAGPASAGQPRPAAPWTADAGRPGTGGDQGHGGSWSAPAGPDPRLAPTSAPAGTGPAGSAARAEGTAGEQDQGGGEPGSTFVFRRPTAADGAPGTPPGGASGAPAAPAAPGVPGPGGPVDAGTMTFRPLPRPDGRTGPAASGPVVPAQGQSAPGAAGGPGFGAGKAPAARASAAPPQDPAQPQAPVQAHPQGPVQAQGPAQIQPPAGAAPAAGAVPAPAPGVPAPASPVSPGAPQPPQSAVPPQSVVPPQSAGPRPAAAMPGSVPAPVAGGPGGGQASWAQQVHQLAGVGAGTGVGAGPVPAAEEQPVAPWKSPVEDLFQAAARRQAAARPAGLGKRFAARLVDTVVLAGVTAVAAVPLGAKAADHVDEKIDAAKLSGRTVTVWLLDGTTAAYLGIVLAVLLLFGVLYEVLPTAKWGRTLGKKLCGLQVRDIEGHEPPSFAPALRRWLVYSVPGLLCVGVVGVLWCVFDRPWRQCWHDKAAHTFVAG
ncbi:RDD family protein [Streptomyces sp. NPDC006743]|uniref:RDD family protein n=1 Tax=Streptomyces sp. NPDC006743 TaxID=3154480 RepID=UPI0034511E78